MKNKKINRNDFCKEFWKKLWTKNNTWNIRCLVDESFVPSPSEPAYYIVDCRISSFYISSNSKFITFHLNFHTFFFFLFEFLRARIYVVFFHHSTHGTILGKFTITYSWSMWIVKPTTFRTLSPRSPFRPVQSLKRKDSIN